VWRQLVHEVLPTASAESDEAAHRYTLTLWLVTEDPNQVTTLTTLTRTQIVILVLHAPTKAESLCPLLSRCPVFACNQ
jgi:hypothetical protein